MKSWARSIGPSAWHHVRRPPVRTDRRSLPFVRRRPGPGSRDRKQRRIECDPLHAARRPRRGRLSARGRDAGTVGNRQRTGYCAGGSAAHLRAGLSRERIGGDRRQRPRPVACEALRRRARWLDRIARRNGYRCSIRRKAGGNAARGRTAHRFREHHIAPLSVAARKVTVLVVDDEPGLVEVLEAYLYDEGFAVLRAADGRAAVEIALAEKPDLVLLDLN